LVNTLTVKNARYNRKFCELIHGVPRNMEPK